MTYLSEGSRFAAEPVAVGQQSHDAVVTETRLRIAVLLQMPCGAALAIYYSASFVQVIEKLAAQLDRKVDRLATKDA